MGCVALRYSRRSAAKVNSELLCRGAWIALKSYSDMRRYDRTSYPHIAIKQVERCGLIMV